MITFAYLRVSTDRQDVANQRHGLLEYANTHSLASRLFVEETMSGRVAWRERAIGQLLSATATPGDIVGRIVITTLEKTPRQDATPPLDWVQPGVMLQRKVKDRRMSRITQERAALAPTLQRLGSKGELTPRGDQATHVHAPGGMQVVPHPIIALHRGELVDHVGQMGSPIRTGAGLPQIPHEVTRRHHEGGP